VSTPSSRTDQALIRWFARLIFPIWSWLRNAHYENPKEILLWRVIAKAPVSVGGPAVEPVGMAEPGQIIWAERWFGAQADWLEEAGWYESEVK